MAIAEGPAVAGKELRYGQAVAVLAALEPLVASFGRGVKDCGKWPMVRRDGAGTPVPGTLHTGGNPRAGT